MLIKNKKKIKRNVYEFCISNRMLRRQKIKIVLDLAEVGACVVRGRF